MPAYIVKPGRRYIHKEFSSSQEAYFFAQEYVDPPWGVKDFPEVPFVSPEIKPTSKATRIQHGPFV